MKTYNVLTESPVMTEASGEEGEYVKFEYHKERVSLYLEKCHDLRNALTNANVRIEELEKLVEHLETQLDKDKQIESLKEEIRKLKL